MYWMSNASQNTPDGQYQKNDVEAENKKGRANKASLRPIFVKFGEASSQDPGESAK
jgi:hypothetical protein